MKDQNREPRHIKTYQDLLDEEQRIRMQYQRDRSKLTTDLNALRNMLQPAEQVMRGINKMLAVPQSHGILSKGADVVLDLLSKKYIFKRAGWFTTLAGSYLIRAVSQMVIGATQQRKNQRDNGSLTREQTKR